MKKEIIIISLLQLAFFVSAQEDIYSKSFVKSQIDKVNDYQYANPWREFDDNWIRGTYYTGVMACYQATGDKKLLDQCDALGNALNWKIPQLKPGHRSSGVNLLTIGQTWLESYMVSKKKYKIKPIINHLDNPEIRNAVSEPLEWYFEGGMRYADGLYTGPPALAMLYKITGKEKYLHWMDACFWDVYGKLFDIEEGLFYRDKRFIQGFDGNVNERFVRPDSIPHEKARFTYIYQKTENEKKVIWSRGNGWVFAGLARILKYLPTDNGNYDRYKDVFIIMADELKKRQQPDGFWYPNMDDPEDFGTKESSGTGFFVYGLAWGINNGILSREDFLPVTEKAWGALVSTVNNEGKVEWGQLEAGGPFKVIQEDSHEFVSGTFLLAASEMYKLAKY